MLRSRHLACSKTISSEKRLNTRQLFKLTYLFDAKKYDVCAKSFDAAGLQGSNMKHKYRNRISKQKIFWVDKFE